jgi:outer membrane protein
LKPHLDLGRIMPAAALIGAALVAAPAHAQDGEPKWFARAGLSGLDLEDKLKLDFGGSPVPGADLSTKTHYTPSVQIGRFIARDLRDFALRAVSRPHRHPGQGALAAVRKLAETTTARRP